MSEQTGSTELPRKLSTNGLEELRTAFSEIAERRGHNTAQARIPDSPLEDSESEYEDRSE